MLLVDAIDNVNKYGQYQGVNMEAGTRDKWCWLPCSLNRNTKIILTMTTNLTEQQTEVDDPALQSLLQHEIAATSFLRLGQFSERLWQDAKTSTCNDWRDQALTASGGGAGGYECLPVLTDEWLKTTSGDDDRTPFHAKALRWLQWMNATPGARPRMPSDTASGRSQLQPEVLMLQFLLESSQFSTDHCEFLLLLVALSKWGIQECDCLEIFQLLTKMDATSTYKVWSRFCWLLAPWLQIIDGHMSLRDRRLRDMILSKYQSKCYKIHKAIRDHYDRKQTFLNKDRTM